MIPEQTAFAGRVLVLMPTLLDAERTASLLQEADVRSVICAELVELCRELREGADAVLMTEEVVLGDTTGQLAEAMRLQPAWSAIPVLVVARDGAGEHIQRAASDAIKSIIIVERPVRTRTLLSVVLSALRGRRHQYEIRDAILLREQQAAVLSAQEERLRFTLSAGGLGAWDLNLDTEELECSDLCRANFGRKPGEPFSYQDLRASIHPEDQARASAAIERSVREGTECDIEYRVTWPDGQTRWLMVRGRASYDASGRPRRMVGVSLDITESKRMQEALQASQSELARQAEQLRSTDRRKDEFLATLAHELRNPLAPIRTGLELLSLSPDAAIAQRTLGVMRRQVGHMVRLIDDLLDVSRITRGKLELKRDRVTLGAVLDAAVEASRPLIDRERHALHVAVSDRSLCFDADLTRMAQVVSNLLNNSSKYTPAGGRIDLSAAKDGDHAVIEVRDNGVGIPPERLDDVFEMFSQVNSALHRPQGGLGIGLALVRSLVEMHGGTVSAASDGQGMGSTFTVRLPLLEMPAMANAPELSARESCGVIKTRVLIVDDNDDAADMLSLMLEQAGYETTTACDGESALAAVEACSPVVVILDIGLPGMSGYDIARELRRKERSAPLALIALTGWGTHEDKQKAMEAGFDIHLTKPIDAELLHAALAKVEGRAGDGMASAASSTKPRLRPLP